MPVEYPWQGKTSFTFKLTREGPKEGSPGKKQDPGRSTELRRPRGPRERPRPSAVGTPGDTLRSQDFPGSLPSLSYVGSFWGSPFCSISITYATRL